MIVVFSNIKSPRFYYAVDLVLRQICGQEYKIVDTQEELKAGACIINYSGKRIKDCFQIHPSGLLTEKGYQKFDVTFEYGGEERLKLFTTEFDDLGYDIFSASFFLATRMEEFWSFKPDEHGRFSSNNSVMSKLGVLHLPLVNIWGKALLQKLNKTFETNLKRDKKFEIINTIDVDNAWAYKSKGVFRTFGGVGRSLLQGDPCSVKERITTLLGRKDPYDTYAYIEKTAREKQVKSIYFFLLGNRNQYDKNVSHTKKQLIELIQSLNKHNEVGIHPSYASFQNLEIQQKEKERLEQIVGKKVTKSRKHFLRMQLPDTYRIYERIGITEDYTMGYADNAGFRAGICTPFIYYDLLQEKMLDLTIYPFAYMDGTLNQYLGLSIEKAIEKVSQLKQEVRNVEGLFIGIWHNETLNDKGIWKGWRKVYEETLTTD